MKQSTNNPTILAQLMYPIVMKWLMLLGGLVMVDTGIRLIIGSFTLLIISIFRIFFLLTSVMCINEYLDNYPAFEKVVKEKLDHHLTHCPSKISKKIIQVKKEQASQTIKNLGLKNKKRLKLSMLDLVFMV